MPSPPPTLPACARNFRYCSAPGCASSLPLLSSLVAVIRPRVKGRVGWSRGVDYGALFACIYSRTRAYKASAHALYSTFASISWRLSRRLRTLSCFSLSHTS
eukprot:Mycagemm_TRINITY_DN10381_c2_g10::TRINITY_DN10381_c2_g10_i1::g.1160::m.1160 type:complete len:102 gc:universal TRINITY_DN10381_c2_g10_i1:676-371(-)